jgi:glutamate racemase
MQTNGPIGVFDSGYGGLTVFKEIANQLPQYDYIYLGDNARVPYGTRSFETVYRYTWECVQELFKLGCNLVILACNTASAKALRSIQQNDLNSISDLKRVLGVIRPTAEVVGNYTKTGNVGILATPGTVASQSYIIEIEKFFPELNVFQEACPMWVPLVENNEIYSPAAEYLVNKNLENLFAKNSQIDTLVLACTHYPLLLNTIKQFTGDEIQIISQGELVAKSLVDYLQRHPEMDALCSKNQQQTFYTTESSVDFDKKSMLFLGKELKSKQLLI